MIDMSKHIEAKSNQLNADDLIGADRTVLITDVKATGEEQPVAIYYDGCAGKPFLPCKTVRRVLVACWGKDAKQYIGKSMTIYRDSEVVYGGVKVGGIRISAMSGLTAQRTIVVSENRKKKVSITIKPLVVEEKSATPEVDEVATAAALAIGQSVACDGTAALMDWWTGLTKAEKLAIKPHMDSMKKVAAEVDAETTPPETQQEVEF